MNDKTVIPPAPAGTPSPRQHWVRGDDNTVTPGKGGTGGWRDRLPELEGLPLLPCGAGKDSKAPIDPATGCLMTGWETAAFSPDQIAALNGVVRCVGTRCGPDAAGLLVIDVDGSSAADWLRAKGCDPDGLQTWRINRTTDADRFKLALLVPKAHWPALIKGKAKLSTGTAEQIELFWSTGQILLLGEHVKTGGTYTWTGSPSTVATAAGPWLALALELLGEPPAAPAPRPPAPTPAADAVPLQALLSRAHSTVFESGAGEGSRNQSAFDLAVGLLTAADGAATAGLPVHGSPEALLLDFAARCSPPLPEREALDCLRSAEGQPRTPDPGLAKRISYQQRRQQSQQPPRTAQPPNGQQGATAPQYGSSKPNKRFKPRPDSTARWGERRLSHGKQMRCLERCIELQAVRERNSLRRRARLLRAAAALGLSKYINRQEIAQRVLEAKDGAQGNSFKALTAADRAAMARPVVRWLLPGLVPADDMTIIGGRPKVGKTRLAVAMVGAVLTGRSLFGLPAPTGARPVILVTDDQADGDTADMLGALDLWTHPQLVWSRNFRLTENDIDALLETVKGNPGALVVIDSLRSIGRALQFGENDPEIGATLYDLKQAVTDAGSTLLLIHHCNKAMDLVGVEALSGHNAIAGAANTVLTMHYLPGVNNQPNKSIPERRLFREGRSGEGLDWVITRDGGSFRKVATMDQWQADAQAEAKLEKLAPTQQLVKAALDDAGGEWMTRRQVCEAIGIEWGDRGRGKEPHRVGDALRRLVELKAAESVRSGTEATYRASHEAPVTTVTTVPVSDTKGSQCHEPNRDNRATVPPPPPTDALARLSRSDRDNETPAPDSVARLSRLSRPLEGDAEPPWHSIAMALQLEHPDWLPAQIALALGAEFRHVTGRAVKEFLAGDQPSP